MTQIAPKIRLNGCDIVGYLYDSDDKSDLGEDMLEVSLPNGILIDAGWYPEGDPDGQYRIAVRDGMRNVIAPLWTLDIYEAVDDVSELVKRFYEHLGYETLSESESSYSEGRITSWQHTGRLVAVR